MPSTSKATSRSTSAAPYETEPTARAVARSKSNTPTAVSVQEIDETNTSQITPVQAPAMELPKALHDNGSRRSRAEKVKKTIKTFNIQASRFFEGADIIRFPVSLEELKKPRSRRVLEEQCAELEGKEAQVMSAIFTDKDGRPILAYFAERPILEEGEMRRTFTAETQYNGRTQDDLDRLKDSGKKIINDGLNEELQTIYQAAAQALCSVTKLKGDSKRHTSAKHMHYTAEAPSDAEDFSAEREEPCGVAHLVQGWQQQAQSEKGLYISGSITRSGTALAGYISYLRATATISRKIDTLLKVVFPEYHEKFRSNFSAGSVFPDDYGPYLGRSIIYKAQGSGHKDSKDGGPSASFGVGQYTGGEYIFPELGIKLKYKPGSVCIFYSSTIYHEVLPFTPNVQTKQMQDDGITPGRIGSVFFFPEGSMEVLEGKEENWAAETAFGRFQFLSGVDS
ncbi:hypothetical protein BDQ17DRAFT_1326062 [Cyathus striatus]|nr:hypothetical protein BDQ17DRAFT_1326062 [Cyathus striatus]